MTETPEERRERIDNARRDQAELLRQVGHEHAAIIIRPSAAEAWDALQARLRKLDDEGKATRCAQKPEGYTDYDAFNVPSPGRAKMLCAGCPALAECGLYAEVDKPSWGVYGGNVFGRDLAEKERREYIRDETNKLKEERNEHA